MTMRILLIMTCFVNIAFAFGSLPWMPEHVAKQFAHDGTPTSYVPSIASAMLLSVLSGIIAAVFFGISLVMPMIAASMPEKINIPNRDYWLNDENRQKTIRHLCFSIELMGILTMFLFLLVQWELFRANQTIPPKMSSNSVLLVGKLYAVVLVFEIVRLLWSLRLPKES